MNSLEVIYDAPIWVFGILSSKMHMAWVKTVGGRLETRYRYSAQLCYNTFPFPSINEEKKKQIEETAENVLVTRAFYPEKTLAELYDPDKMPEDLKEAHAVLDDIVESCYPGYPFANDEARLECLFKLYEKMTNKNNMEVQNIVNINYQQTGASSATNNLGMREMQAKAYEVRNQRFLLIKAPPASGKSRALMFIALDKLANQGIKKVIVAVPEKSIGRSFKIQT